jgi:hypothetical protein
MKSFAELIPKRRGAVASGGQKTDRDGGFYGARPKVDETPVAAVQPTCFTPDSC